jgi:hypothetical protein
MDQYQPLDRRTFRFLKSQACSALYRFRERNPVDAIYSGWANDEQKTNQVNLDSGHYLALVPGDRIGFNE